MNDKASPGESRKMPADILEFQPGGIEIENRPVPVVARATLYILVAFIVFALTWACIAEVDKIVVAHGKTISTSPDVMVQPMVTSIVRQIHVEVGQVLRKGDKLVTLDPTFAEADATSVDQRIATLKLRQARLRAEIEGRPFTAKEFSHQPEALLQERIFNGRKQEYGARIQAYNQARLEHQAVIELTTLQLAQRRKQMQIFEEVEGLHRDLYDRGVQSKVEKLQAENQVYSMAVEISKLETTIEERRHTLTRQEEEKKIFLNNWLREAARELDEINTELESLIQQASKARRLHELVDLVCSADAVVLDIGDYAPGTIAKEGETIMRLSPLNGTLEAEVEILASDIGYLQVGETCRIKFDTFPFQRHGTADGVLRVLSEDAFQNQARPELPLVYRGRITITDKHLRLVPEEFRFLPGMSLVSEINVGKRKVITYFLYPLIKMFDEGMRTP
jgi:HlyD family secretion protein